MLERWRHDANHLHALTVQLNGSSDDAGVGAEVRRPESVAQDDDAVRIRLVLFIGEHAPEGWRHAKRSEEVAGYEQTLQPLGRLSVAGQHRSHADERDHLVEDVVPLTEVHEVRGRVRPAVGMNRSAEDLNESLGVGIRQRLEEIGVEHAEHRGVGADAESQCHDGDGGEPGRATKRSRRVAKILKEIVPHSDFVGRTPDGKGW